MEQKKINIAIDGPVASGKGITSKLLATKLNYNYLDTGAMYRAIGYYLNKKNISKETFKNSDLNNLNIEFNEFNDVILNGINIENEIRTPLGGELASTFSTIPEIRKFLVKIQKQIIKNGGFIAEGRDIGTVVIPDAEIKIYLTADLETRAKRRLEDFKIKGLLYTLEEIKLQISQRDHQDMTREDSPLTKAKHALEIDNSNYSIEETVNIIYTIIKKVINKNN